MTNKEALLSVVEFLEVEVSDKLIERTLAEAKTDGATEYGAAEFGKVALAEYKLLTLLSAKPEIKDGPYSRKFNLDTRLQELSVRFKPRPTITNASNYW